MKYLLIVVMLLFPGLLYSQSTQKYVTQPGTVSAYGDFLIIPQFIAIPISTIGVPYYYEVGFDLRPQSVAGPITAPYTIPQQIPINPNTQVELVFKSICITCHKPGKDKPGVQLLNENATLFINKDYKTELARRQLILKAVEHSNNGVSKMPKNGNKLPDDQLNIIRKWVSGGL